MRRLAFCACAVTPRYIIEHAKLKLSTNSLRSVFIAYLLRNKDFPLDVRSQQQSLRTRE